MKRIVLWLLSTVSAVVLLFGYHTSTSGARRHGPGPGRREPGHDQPPTHRRSGGTGSATAVDRHRRPTSPGRSRRPAGDRSRCSSPRTRRERSPTSKWCSTPPATARTSRSTPTPCRSWSRRPWTPRAPTSTWSAAPPSRARATSSRCSRRSTRPGMTPSPGRRRLGTSSTSWGCRSAWPCAAGTPTTTRLAVPGPRRWPRYGTSTASSAPTAPTRSSHGSPATRSPSRTARRRWLRCSRWGSWLGCSRTVPSTYAAAACSTPAAW